MRRFCVALMILAALRLHAAVSESIASLSITNASDYLIAADADRAGVQARAVVVWANDALLGSSSRTTEYSFQLRSGSTPISIVTESGVTGTVYRITNSVTVAANSQMRRTNVVTLRPTVRLDPFTQYHARLELFAEGASTRDTSNSVTRQFWHFTNLVSGDAAFNALGAMEDSTWEKSYVVDTVPGQERFEITNTFRMVRYDDFNASQVSANIPVRLSWQLQDTNGAVIPTTPGSTNFTVGLFNFENGTPREPRDRTYGRIISFRPLQQLDSVSNRYRVVVTLSITNLPGTPVLVMNDATTPASRLRHFNGTLLFDTVQATLTNLNSEPAALFTSAGLDYLNTSIDGTAILDAAPSRDFNINGLTFRLRANGTASFASGSIFVPSPTGGDFTTNGNVRIRRLNLTLTEDGATADLRFHLPAGFGIATNYAAVRRLQSQWLFQDIGLTASLQPRTNIFVNGPLVATTESKPILILADRMTWSVGLQRFTLIPNSFPILGTRTLDEFQLLSRSNLVESLDMTTKRANDSYYRFMNGFDGNIIVTASASGIAQVSYTATFTDGDFKPHFPVGPAINWSTGTLQVANNSVVPGTSSKLEGVGNIVQRYISNCSGCDGLFTTSSLSMTPSNNVLSFTRDGGLVATREPGIGPVQNLSWGFSSNVAAFAHRASAVNDLSFHMPGHFLRGIDDTSSGANPAGVLHLTGVAASNLTVIERPLTSGYDNVGRADYAGMNIRSSSAGTSQGQERITGVSATFNRAPRSKYYARLAGVSGVHEAVPGSFAANLTLLGYPFTFDNYGLSFLDSQNVDSRTEGSVSVPYPANITLPFRELLLTCAGGLESAQLPANVGYRYLDYWRADIQPQSIRFQGKPGDECDPTTAYLVVGVRAHASNVSDPLSGTLGFFSNGSLIPPAFNLPGVSSRFDLPSQFKFAGPAGSTYVLTPVTSAYFTSNDVAQAPVGYLSFAGKLNLPFFEDVKVHVHTGARTNGTPNPEIKIAGGWPAAGAANVFGWQRGTNHYFNNADFDDINRGFPDGVSLAAYHANDTSDTYKPRAERQWLDVVDLSYPLVWDPTLHHFQAARSVTSSLLVITATHRVSYLDPRQAVLDIGPRYDGLPVVTLSHLLVDEGGAGAATAVRNSIGSTAYTAITNGMAAADLLLSENAAQLADRLIAVSVDNVLQTLVSTMASQWNGYKNQSQNQRAQFRNVALTNVLSYFLGGNGITDTVERRLRYLGVGGLPFGGELFPALSSDVNRLSVGMTRTAESFTGGGTGANTIRQLVGVSAPQFNAAVAGPELNAALGAEASAFQEIQSQLLAARDSVRSYTNGLPNASSEWADEIEVFWNAQASALEEIANTAALAAASIMGGYNYRVDDPFAGSGQAELRTRMRNEVLNLLMGEHAVVALRTSIKQRLFDLNAGYRSAANSALARYNSVARDLISRSLADVDNSFAPGLGTLANFFEVSRVQGHAEIQDESLRQLRLDGRFKLKVPEDMAFNAYLEIRELNSENTPEECLYPGSTATEVKFGATDVELDWISDDLRADVGTKITLVNGSPRGFAGSFETRGPLEFGGFVVKQIGFAMAFGDQENYLAANARVKMGQSAEIAGGVFFGRACSIDPLTVAVASVSPYLLTSVNPVDIFGEPPFTGAFVYGEGTFPIWSVGCLFEVRVTAGAGAWYFKEGPKYGGIIKAGIGGTVLCVLSAEGNVTLIGSKRDNGMTFVGMAHVEGCLGFWPFEICIDGDTAVKYVEGREWDADEP